MINAVRNTVLSVLNKNNYGYISPSDFNLYAKNAQMEIFEEYFSSYNKALNMENQRGAGTDYANIKQTIAEAMEVFLVTNPLKPSLGLFYYAPSLTTTGDEVYMFNKIMVSCSGLLTIGTNSSIFPYQVYDNSNVFTGIVNVGDIVIAEQSNKFAYVSWVAGPDTLYLTDSIFNVAAAETYWIFSASSYNEAEKVSNGKIQQLLSSNLTAPNCKYPSYVQIGDIIQIYPYQSVIQSNGAAAPGYALATYFRIPKDPKWTYITLTGGEPVFDQSQPDYQDFEIPLEDEYKLVMKILQYCGMSIRESEVAAFGMQQEQHEQPSFSMQQ